MGKVKFTKATTGAFQDLLDDGLVNANTLYFVSDTGDFSPSSLDTDGSLYLGDKLISSPHKPAFYYGVCTVAENVQAKDVTVDAGILPLTAGVVLLVSFSKYNSASSPTIRINGDSRTDAPIKRYGTTAAGTASYTSWNSGSTVCIVYDGAAWQMVGWLNTIYSDFTSATDSAAGTHGLVPAPPARSHENTLLTSQGWKDDLLINVGSHCGGTDNNLVWAEVIKGTGRNGVSSTEDFTAVIMVTKHTTSTNEVNSARVGIFTIDFRANQTVYGITSRWLLRTETLGTPEIKIGVKIEDGKYVVRVYVLNKSWATYSFKILASFGWDSVGFIWRCYRGRTGNNNINTYTTLPAYADEDINSMDNDVAINAMVSDAETLDGHPASYFATADNFVGSDDSSAGSAGLVPAPPMTTHTLFLSNDKNNIWKRPDTTPTANSANVITSGAVYAAIGDIENLLANI